jgi:hypothetical protein
MYDAAAVVSYLNDAAIARALAALIERAEQYSQHHVWPQCPCHQVAAGFQQPERAGGGEMSGEQKPDYSAVVVIKGYTYARLPSGFVWGALVSEADVYGGWLPLGDMTTEGVETIAHDAMDALYRVEMAFQDERRRLLGIISGLQAQLPNPLVTRPPQRNDEEIAAAIADPNAAPEPSALQAP